MLLTAGLASTCRCAVARLRRGAGARVARSLVCASALLGLLALVGCSPADVYGLWAAYQAPASGSGGGAAGCPAGDPVISPVVEPRTVMRWSSTVCSVFDPEDAATALCVISYESGGEPHRTNRDDPGRGSFGLMQINSDWWIGSEYHEEMVAAFGRKDETYLDPAVNVAAAALLVNDPDLSGWHAWSASRLCPHRHSGERDQAPDKSARVIPVVLRVP